MDIVLRNLEYYHF